MDTSSADHKQYIYEIIKAEIPLHVTTYIGEICTMCYGRKIVKKEEAN